MQDDFHYYCLAKLAYHAGFSEDDAILIAHASAFTDHCDREKDLQLRDEDYEVIKTQSILCLDSLKPETHVETYFPFHFIPRYKEGVSKDTPDFNTYAFEDNDTAKNLFTFITEKISSEKDKDTSLIRLGIALHAIADTYSHKTFASIQDIKNKVPEAIANCNNPGGFSIKDIELETCYGDSSDFNDLNERQKADFLCIGHASIRSLPDQPLKIWGRSEGQIINNRTDTFEPACEKIYHLLLEARKAFEGNLIHSPKCIFNKEKPYQDIKDEIYNMLFGVDEGTPATDRIKYIISNDKDNLFIDNKFRKNEWVEAIYKLEMAQDVPYSALHSTHHENNVRACIYEFLPFKKFATTYFYKFQECAKEHRNFVLDYLNTGIYNLDPPEPHKNTKNLISNIYDYQQSNLS